MNDPIIRTPPIRTANPPVPGYDPVAYHAQLFGPWQAGSELVMLKDEPLPDRCVASNDAADVRRRMRFAWHPPGYYALLLLGVLPYAIVASFMTQKATIYVPLGKEWRDKRRRMIYLGLLLIVVGFLLIIAGPALDKVIREWGWVMLVGVIVLIFGFDRALNGARPLKPTKITESMIWLKGAGPRYLATLPVYLGENALPPTPFAMPSEPLPYTPAPPPLPPQMGK